MGALFISAVWATSVIGQSLTRFTYTEYHMGVDARVVVYAKDQTSAEKACTEAFQRMAELDSMMSDYRADSELMRLCDRAGGPPVKVSPELFRVLEFAERVSTATGGAFDVTVGPLVKLWRQARKSKVAPSPSAIAEARKLVGWRKVHLDAKDHTVRLDTPGMRLDLGGIGKGYCDDEVQAVFQRHGIRSALVEMGGDIVVTDPPPGEKGWKIRVPNAGSDHGPAELVFRNCAISTSGDTEQFVVIDGKRYSHVVDPRTGWALTNRVQATIIAKNGLWSDPLSKCMALLTPAELKRVWQAFPGCRTYVRVAKD